MVQEHHVIAENGFIREHFRIHYLWKNFGGATVSILGERVLLEREQKYIIHVDYGLRESIDCFHSYKDRQKMKREH